MTSVNVTTQSNTVTVQQGDATTVTIATQGPQGPAGSGSSNVVDDTSPQLGGDLQSNGNDIDFADNDKAIFGTGSDLQIFHNESNSIIRDSGQGNLFIDSNRLEVRNSGGGETQAVFLQDGSVSLYHNNVKKVETSATGIDVTGTVDLSSAETNASNTAQFKLSNLTIGQHNNIGSYRFANAGTGSFLLTADNINFFNKDVNKSFLRLSASAVELYHDNVKKAETSADGLKVDSSLFINSGSGTLQALRFHNDITGTGINDGAAITYSTNSHALFVSCPESTGNMVFQTGGSQMNNRTLLISNSGVVTLQRNQEPMLVATPNAGVELYHNNVKKAQTSSTGFDIPEDFVAGSGSKLTVGASGDLTLFHDSTNSYVQNNTGDLILGDTNHQYFRGNTSDKSVSLYFNGSEKAKTNNTGFSVTGSITASTGATFGGTATFASDGYLTTTSGITIENTQPGIIFSDTSANPDYIIQNRDGSFAVRDLTNAANRFLIDTANGNITATGNINLPDNSKLQLGDSQDLQIYHNTNSYIDNSTGITFIRNTGSNGSQIQLLNNNSGLKIQGLTGEQSIIANANGSVELYHNNVKKLETTNSGITVTGSVTTQDMNMSNLNGTANEVDNTKGSWSIQEGADDLFLINRVSGKKYKFNLTEVS